MIHQRRVTLRLPEDGKTLLEALVISKEHFNLFFFSLYSLLSWHFYSNNNNKERLWQNIRTKCAQYIYFTWLWEITLFFPCTFWGYDLWTLVVDMSLRESPSMDTKMYQLMIRNSTLHEINSLKSIKQAHRNDECWSQRNPVGPEPAAYYDPQSHCTLKQCPATRVIMAGTKEEVRWFNGKSDKVPIWGRLSLLDGCTKHKRPQSVHSKPVVSAPQFHSLNYALTTWLWSSSMALEVKIPSFPNRDFSYQPYCYNHSW